MRQKSSCFALTKDGVFLFIQSRYFLSPIHIESTGPTTLMRRDTEQADTMQWFCQQTQFSVVTKSWFVQGFSSTDTILSTFLYYMYAYVNEGLKDNCQRKHLLHLWKCNIGLQKWTVTIIRSRWWDKEQGKLNSHLPSWGYFPLWISGSVDPRSNKNLSCHKHPFCEGPSCVFWPRAPLSQVLPIMMQ